MKKAIAIILSVVVFASCSSTTMIRTTDPQAKIYVNNTFKGTGSATHTDSSIVGTTNVVRVEKTGCEPAFYTFSRTEEFDAGACASGLLTVGVMFLWIQKYKPERTYEYNCVSTAQKK